MSMAIVYQPPQKPKVGGYLEHIRTGQLWKVRHISRKSGIITCHIKSVAIMKVHKKRYSSHFNVRNDIL